MQYITRGNFIFQYDNVAVYWAKFIETYYRNKKISVLLWFARYLDLNSIKNYRGELYPFLHLQEVSVSPRFVLRE